MFEVNNIDTKMTPVALVSLLLTLLLTCFVPCSSVSIVNFEQVNTGWVHLVLVITKYSEKPSELTFTCSKLTIETLEKGVKYVQSKQ